MRFKISIIAGMFAFVIVVLSRPHTRIRVLNAS
jgi:hypothetical protein